MTFNRKKICGSLNFINQPIIFNNIFHLFIIVAIIFHYFQLVFLMFAMKYLWFKLIFKTANSMKNYLKNKKVLLKVKLVCWLFIYIFFKLLKSIHAIWLIYFVSKFLPFIGLLFSFSINKLQNLCTNLNWKSSRNIFEYFKVFKLFNKLVDGTIFFINCS